MDRLERQNALPKVGGEAAESPVTESKIEILSAVEAAGLAVRTLTGPSRPTVLRGEDAQTLCSAAEVLRRAREALERVETAVQRGHEEGKREGFAEGLADAHRSLVSARREHEALLARAEPDVVTLALELSRRVVGRALELDPSLLSDMFAQTLAAAKGRARVTLVINPDDLDAVAGSLERFDGAAGVAVTASTDPRVPRHACRIETERGVIEASIDTQLDALGKALLGEVGQP